jgi:hypothetical protein
MNDMSVSNMNLIALTWYDGLSNGGSPILNYTVWYDPGQTGTYFSL